MDDQTHLLKEPAFQELLARRSRWRWSFSAIIIGAYLCFALSGMYNKDFFASPFMGLALPWGMAMGLAIIFMSIVFSVVYVRTVNRIESDYRQAIESSS